MTLAEYLTIAADNCVHNGDVDIAVLMRQAASTITRQEAQLAESEKARERMRAFVEEVSKQTPEKPDYWSSCGQCSHNISEAEDIIDALAAEKGEKE